MEIYSQSCGGSVEFCGGSVQDSLVGSIQEHFVMGVQSFVVGVSKTVLSGGITKVGV